MAALSRFISRLGEKALPLYRLLRRTEHFEWTDATTAGLKEIKAILATNSDLAAPNLGEPMLLYMQQHIKLSARYSSSSERQKGTDSLFKNQCTTYPLF